LVWADVTPAVAKEVAISAVLKKDLIREEISFIGSFLMEWINLVKSEVM
jgi:hypothetical protein